MVGSRTCRPWAGSPGYAEFRQEQLPLVFSAANRLLPELAARGAIAQRIHDQERADDQLRAAVD